MPPCSVARTRLLGLVLLTAVCGCGGGPTLVPVSGTVTHNGKPLPRLSVYFVPDAGRTSWGTTDEKGNYTLRYDRDHMGALPGSYKVYVRWVPKTPAEEAQLASGEWNPFPDWPAIKEKYGSLQTTKLRVEVKEDGQPINLTLD